MTKEEAILQLENLKEHCNEMSKSNKMWESDVIAIDVAIRSLKDDRNEIVIPSEVKVIPLDKVKKAREEIENLTPWDEGLVEMYNVLEILDKLIESEDK